MKMRRIMLLLLMVVVLPTWAKAQTLADSSDSSGAAAIANPAYPELTYIRPTTKIKLHSYLFDAFGPYPLVGAGIAAGINQASDTPPEWMQGATGYSKRFVSDFGIAAVTTTTRYALARAFREDTSYYRCECKGVFPGCRTCVISTFTARRGEDGHRVFSYSVARRAICRYHDCGLWMVSRPLQRRRRLRMGNYSLLTYGRECCSGISVQRTALVIFTHSSEQWSWRARCRVQTSDGSEINGGRRYSQSLQRGRGLCMCLPHWMLRGS